MADLSVFFNPQGVAIIGASRDPEKLGYSVIYNLVTHHYSGHIYPINPKAQEILNYPAYASIQDVPDPLDLAIIVVPAQYVEQALLDCGKRGVHAVTIVSGGFREVGPEGAELENRIKQIAKHYDIAILGPNCIGTIDTHTPINTTFVTTGHPLQGQIALLSQSGATAAAIIDWAKTAGVGFSRIVSLGNQAGVTESDMLLSLGNDPNTNVITVYLEGVSNGRQFLENATEIAQEKPIVALKVGRSSGGAKAVTSHTGALAGAESAYDAAFRRAGILRASTLEEMMDWARALAWQALPAGNKVAVLTNAGGPGIMAVDSLEMAGMQLAPLTDRTKAFLRERVPPAASINNPVDILAGSGPATYALCLDALLMDETVDAIVVISAPQDWFDPVSLAEVVGEVNNTPLGRKKPILSVIMGLDSHSNGTKILHRKRTPNFNFPERIGSTLGAMWKRKQWLDEQQNTQDSEAFEPCCELDAVALAIKSSKGLMQSDLVEVLLKVYEIPVPQSEITTNVEQALETAADIGYPIALKLAAKHTSHKSDIGGVMLNINSSEDLKSAYATMLKRVASHLIEGIYVQQMIVSGVEVIIGVVRDPQFGPLVMVGSGGIHVELFEDVTFELAPITPRQANQMLERTAAGRLLDGYRGHPSGNRQAVIRTICNLAQIALDWPQILEIEVNPLIALPDGVYAVDSRISVAKV